MKIFNTIFRLLSWLYILFFVEETTWDLRTLFHYIAFTLFVVTMEITNAIENNKNKKNNKA